MTRRPGGLRGLGLSLVALVGLAVVATPLLAGVGGPATAGADGAPGWSATVTPTTGLADGKRVTINVRSVPGTNVYEGSAAVCRAGVAYQPSDGLRYNADARPNGANCSLAPLSSSSDSSVVDDDMTTGAASAAGETMALRVGVGVVNWTDPDGVARSLTCDPSTTCDLVLEIYAGPSDGSAQPTWVPFVQPLTYIDSDPLTTCGGAAANSLTTGASDSLVDAWTQWTLDQCKQPGQAGAATRMSFVGEGQAVQQFNSGLLDLAYTSTGDDPDVALDPTVTATTPARPSVAVPVGIGAVTLGVGNGYGAGGKKVPYPTISLTAADLATLVGSGSYTSLDQQAPIVGRNPTLSGAFFAPSTDLQVGVPSGASSSTWYLSNYLNSVASSSWKVPPVGAAGPDANKSRGVFNDFATADPDFELMTSYTGRPNLDKLLYGIVNNAFLLGGVYVVTDLTTAIGESLSPAAIQTSSTGPFVAPTVASMDAAVAEMKPDAQGMLQPDPTTWAAAASRSTSGPGAVPAAADPNAYPLTYVDYALVPAQPLVDGTCTPRPDAQTQLTTWLTYLTTGGQKVLPDGLAPLTPALQAQAAAAIAKVGATPNTCTPPTAPDAVAPLAGSGGSDGSGGLGPGSSDLGSTGLGSGGANPVSVLAAGPDALGRRQAIAAKVSVPPFGGSGVVNTLITVLALLAVVALVTLTVRFSSGFGRAPPDDPDAGVEPGFHPGGSSP